LDASNRKDRYVMHLAPLLEVPRNYWKGSKEWSGAIGDPARAHRAGPIPGSLSRPAERGLDRAMRGMPASIPAFAFEMTEKELEYG
jgi:hypothetical protein